MESMERIETVIVSGEQARQANRTVTTSTAIVTIGVLCFAALVLILHLLRPDLNPISEPTSAYAVGPYSLLMTLAFLSFSTASFALVFGLYHRLQASARSRTGLVLLGTWAAGVVIAMIFPMDADGEPVTTSGTIHQTTGPFAFLCLTGGMLFVSWAFQENKAWRSLSGTALTLSLMMLVGFVATFLSFATDSGTLGIAQRITLTIAIIWMLLTVARLRSISSENPNLRISNSPSGSR